MHLFWDGLGSSLWLKFGHIKNLMAISFSLFYDYLTGKSKLILSSVIFQHIRLTEVGTPSICVTQLTLWGGARTNLKSKERKNRVGYLSNLFPIFLTNLYKHCTRMFVWKGKKRYLHGCIHRHNVHCYSSSPWMFLTTRKSFVRLCYNLVVHVAILSCDAFQRRLFTLLICPWRALYYPGIDH